MEVPTDGSASVAHDAMARCGGCDREADTDDKVDEFATGVDATAATVEIGALESDAIIIG